jgi:hypothetical protein
MTGRVRGQVALESTVAVLAAAQQTSEGEGQL